ncbi:MAG: hypothetical protein CBCREVIR_3011 [Candidatus Burkholderia crenata]|nr:MAG: hypothetical protein CBCREVIR_3011 [Candidatus Burkholderia crenata]
MPFNTASSAQAPNMPKPKTVSKEDQLPSHEWGLDKIVADLRASREQLYRTRRPLGIRELP